MCARWRICRRPDLAHAGHRTLPLRPVSALVGPAVDGLDRAADRRQRVAQLVRQHRQELVLAPVRLAQGLHQLAPGVQGSAQLGVHAAPAGPGCVSSRSAMSLNARASVPTSSGSSPGCGPPAQIALGQRLGGPGHRADPSGKVPGQRACQQRGQQAGQDHAGPHHRADPGQRAIGAGHLLRGQHHPVAARHGRVPDQQAAVIGVEQLQRARLAARGPGPPPRAARLADSSSAPPPGIPQHRPVPADRSAARR